MLTLISFNGIMLGRWGPDPKGAGATGDADKPGPTNVGGAAGRIERGVAVRVITIRSINACEKGARLWNSWLKTSIHQRVGSPRWGWTFRHYRWCAILWSAPPARQRKSEPPLRKALQSRFLTVYRPFSTVFPVRPNRESSEESNIRPFSPAARPLKNGENGENGGSRRRGYPPPRTVGENRRARSRCSGACRSRKAGASRSLRRTAGARHRLRWHA